MVREYNDILEAVRSVKSKQAVIFDMDGLIFDTERVFMEQLAVAMKEHGYVLTREIYTETLGLGGKKLVDFMQSKFGYDYPFEECSRKAQERMAMISETIGLSVKPQIRELLQELKAGNIKCGVASSTKTELVEKYLKQAELDGFFDVVIGGDKVKVSKPGWNCDIGGIKEYDKLPKECRDYIEFIEKEIGVPIKMVSNGPKRHDIIHRA